MFEALRAWRIRQKPMFILDFESYSFDPSDLKPGKIVYMSDAEGCAPDSLADMIEDANWWTRLSDPGLFRAGANRIRRLVRERDSALDKVNQRNTDLTKERSATRKARDEAKDIVSRAGLIISEMKSVRGSRTPMTPAAIVISPSQWANLTLHGYMPVGKQKKREEGLPPLRTLHGVPLFTAKGVFGPVVMTEDGFNAFSRSAPELNLTTAR